MWEDIERENHPTKPLLDRADVVFRRWARPRLKDRSLVGFIAEDASGSFLGSGAVWLQPSQPRPWWEGGTIPYLMSMYVRPEARGRGVASAIVRAAIAWSRAKGFPRIVLHASEMGRGVYARIGFERTWEMRYPLAPRLPIGAGPAAVRRRMAKDRGRAATAGPRRRGARRGAGPSSSSFR